MTANSSAERRIGVKTSLFSIQHSAGLGGDGCVTVPVCASLAPPRHLQMPELPDIVVYVEALKTRLVGRRLERVNLLSPFVLRSVEPAIDTVTSRIVRDVLRVGKRI